VPEEAEMVRIIFRCYLELGSMGALIEDLDRRGIRTKAIARLDGRLRGGIRFGVGPLAYLLKNRFYLGEVVYRGEVHAGEHEPILDRELFEAVQAKRAANAVARVSVLFGPCYNGLTFQFTRRDDTRSGSGRKRQDSRAAIREAVVHACKTTWRKFSHPAARNWLKDPT
jgi:Recombinase